MKESWVPTLRTAIRTSLERISKGWYNLDETSYEVYQDSKLKKLMELIKFAMQDSIRTLVLESLKAFVQSVEDACHSCLELPGDFSWVDALTHSPFQ